MQVVPLKKTDAPQKAQDRRGLAERLLMLSVKHAPVFAEIDDLKEKLRLIAESAGKGFTEEFGDGRSVKVTSPSESKFKGIVPVFDAAAFLDLPEKQRQKLIDGKIVAMEKQFTQARRPSVSVEWC
jgi:hypothetical protein